MRLSASRRIEMIVLGLMLITLLASCIEPSTPWPDHLGGARYQSFGNTEAYEILTGFGRLKGAHGVHSQWQTNELGESEPVNNQFELEVDGDGVLLAGMSNGLSMSCAARAGFEGLLLPEGSTSTIRYQMHIKAAEATRVEVTGLGLGDLPEPYFAEDGSDAWYDITTSLNETGFGLSGNIVLYGDFSGTDAGDSLVEFLFRPLDDLNDRKSGKLTVTVEKVDGGEVAGLPVSVGGDLSAPPYTQINRASSS